MKLFIHFGIYKAGSSYLQYILANSRNYLEHHKIYFPESKEDFKMLQGYISKGNADGLAQALNMEDASHSQLILTQWFQQAKKQQCTSVLISAEALVHQLARENSLKVLKKAAKASGFNQIHAMGFFRDLADHAISTYKHRAKSGKIPDYKHWIKEVYETPNLLENLAKIRSNNSDISWTFRKFQKNSSILEEAFFQDWLQINVPEFSGKPTVNESVTLSEVFLMNEIKKKYPLVTDYFVHLLTSLPSAEKGKDKELENYIGSTFFISLTKRTSGMMALNKFLDPKEQLVLMDEGKLNNINDDYVPNLNFSEKQIHLILEKIEFFKGIKGNLIILRRKIAKKLPDSTVKILFFNTK